MKAAICTKYGNPSFLKLVDVSKPTPKEDQILVKIHASSVTSGDARIRRADPCIIRLIFGFRKPRKSVLGVVVAGEIESVEFNNKSFHSREPACQRSDSVLRPMP